MSALLKALEEQQKLMDSTGQSALSPHEYLYLSASGRPTTSGGAASQPSSPSRVVAQLSPSRIHDSIVTSHSVVTVSSPNKTGNPNAILEGAIVEVDAHPATGYPSAVDAYMNNLPQELYAPKTFLAKHVTDTLQLCLKVLEKNHTARGGKLTMQDETLLRQIAAFGPKAEVVAPLPIEMKSSEAAIIPETEVQQPQIISSGEPSADPAESGLREAKY